MAKVTKVIQRMFFRSSYVLTLIPIAVTYYSGHLVMPQTKTWILIRHLKIRRNSKSYGNKTGTGTTLFSIQLKILQAQSMGLFIIRQTKIGPKQH